MKTQSHPEHKYIIKTGCNGKCISCQFFIDKQCTNEEQLFNDKLSSK